MTKYLGVATDEPRVTSLKVGSNGASSVFTAMGRISQSLTPVSVATITCAEQAFTVPGLAVGDVVTVSPPGITAGVAPVCARVSAANTLQITFCNPTAGPLVPAAGVYQIFIAR
jgi:hypothetical protein